MPKASKVENFSTELQILLFSDKSESQQESFVARANLQKSSVIVECTSAENFNKIHFLWTEIR